MKTVLKDAMEMVLKDGRFMLIATDCIEEIEEDGIDTLKFTVKRKEERIPKMAILSVNEKRNGGGSYLYNFFETNSNITASNTCWAFADIAKKYGDVGIKQNKELRIHEEETEAYSKLSIEDRNKIYMSKKCSTISIKQENIYLLKEDILCIEWVDATSFKGWWDKEELEKESLLKVTSIGIELSRDEQVILIAQSVDIKNEQFRNLQMIPISCIIKEEIIKHGKKEK